MDSFIAHSSMYYILLVYNINVCSLNSSCWMFYIAVYIFSAHSRTQIPKPILRYVATPKKNYSHMNGVAKCCVRDVISLVVSILPFVLCLYIHVRAFSRFAIQRQSQLTIVVCTQCYMEHSRLRFYARLILFSSFLSLTFESIRFSQATSRIYIHVGFVGVLPLFCAQKSIFLSL